MKYWLYRTHIYSHHNRLVQAKLVSDLTHSRSSQDCGFGFPSPRQSHPYGVDLALTYQIAVHDRHPDNYYETMGFTLYSEKLVNLMQHFGVQAEKFPVIMIDQNGNALPELRYFIFHVLEGIHDVLDEEASGWSGDARLGLKQLVLKEPQTQERPLLTCNHVYTTLMSDDLKQAIREQAITGFDFLSPERYRSGEYGTCPNYDE